MKINVSSNYHNVNGGLEFISFLENKIYLLKDFHPVTPKATCFCRDPFAFTMSRQKYNNCVIYLDRQSLYKCSTLLKFTIESTECNKFTVAKFNLSFKVDFFSYLFLYVICHFIFKQRS